MPVEVGMDAQQVAGTAQVDAAAEHRRVGDQPLDARQHLEEFDEGRGVELLQRATHQRRQQLLLGRRDLLLETLVAVVVPTHRVFGAREFVGQRLGGLEAQQTVEHRVGIRIGRGVFRRARLREGREGGRVEHVIHACIHR
jgi:hypothetical protein